MHYRAREPNGSDGRRYSQAMSAPSGPGGVDLVGLRRRDALVLAALAMKPDRNAPRLRRFMRVLLMRRFRVRGALRRLEARGFIEPGWCIDRHRPHCVVTDEGHRAARAAVVTLALEDFAGP